ncbi:MAG TPA: Pvc16 family protein [Capsulimonadaceae bacterium]|nr:Pvc16 family protein [Capsulimonadaceae bacterium]
MIADIDEILRRMILTELAGLPDCPVRHPSQITFDPPSIAEAAQDGEARINLYLMDVRENMERRGEGLQIRRRPEEQKASQKRTPVYIDLSYLVTAYAGNDPIVEHRLLSDVLGVLLRCLAAPAQYLMGVFEGLGPNIVEIAAAQPDRLVSDDPSSLWQALESQMRPAISLMVTAPFDPFETKWTRLVREAVIALRHGNGNQSAGEPLDLGRMRVSIAGLVVDDKDEAPIAGVSVSVAGDEARTTTDERGFFYFLNLPASSERFLFERPGFAPTDATRPQPKAGQPAPRDPLVVKLIRQTDRELAAAAEWQAAERKVSDANPGGFTHSYVLSGVLRYASGEPAAYIPVRAGGKETSTDSRGVYLFTDLPPGDHTVIADLPGLGEVTVRAEGGTAVLSRSDTH